MVMRQLESGNKFSAQAESLVVVVEPVSLTFFCPPISFEITAHEIIIFLSRLIAVAKRKLKIVSHYSLHQFSYLHILMLLRK